MSELGLQPIFTVKQVVVRAGHFGELVSDDESLMLRANFGESPKGSERDAKTKEETEHGAFTVA